MVSEDFSFPKITNPFPHFPVTPSLWRVSSVIYPDFHYGDYDDDDDEMAFLKNTEEKMDMLWEDFNEELSSLRENKQLSSKSNNCKTGDHQLCCVQALKLSKRCTTLYHPKKQRLVLVLKVLKKIFLLHKSTQIKNS